MKPTKKFSEPKSQHDCSPKQAVPPPSAEGFPIALRAYVPAGPAPKGEKGFRKTNAGPSEWTLVFDTETTTEPAQRLRFGSFQVWKGNQLFKAGLFYSPDVLKLSEQKTLRRYAQKHRLDVLTVAEFVDEIFYGIGYDFRANIVGFNLPFDISRLAISHDSARNRRGQGTLGAFTFKLSTKFWRPRVVIQHHSRTLAFIWFAGAPETNASRSSRKRKRTPVFRGYFLDLRTAATALTGKPHSLESLADELDVELKKHKTAEHGKPLTDQYIQYAMRDAEATWACFLVLSKRFAAHELRGTRINKIYSGASLGKAYLRQMGIAPWRQCQPDFPSVLLGNIMSTYYGGRAEVRLRRAINQVLYCDFTSMYPTVCSLMGLWDFVIAEGMSWRDATEEVQLLLNRATLSDLQEIGFWKQLRTIVQVQPSADIFPVRARYGVQAQYTIGVNYVTADFPMWFTLADCIASKLLTGRAPRIVHAYSFEPDKPQSTLFPTDIMGNTEFRIDPRMDDFYRSLIDLRMDVRSREKKASGRQRERFNSEQLALKILANATSYGIFVELNVEELRATKQLKRFGATENADIVRSNKIEEPGNYFYPLLGTLITGAARLMLAIVETQAARSGLDWAFCDTDSMALTNPPAMSTREFYALGQNICDWFKPLNPYSKDTEIFKIEDENRPIGGKSKSRLKPLFCYAVSAKRYALFNVDDHGKPILRKASAHGLGHWLPPYDEKHAPRSFPTPAVKIEGLARWQHDLWYRIILAAQSGDDTGSNPAGHRGFNKPVASSYHATKPFILRWFKGYNATRPSDQQVRPFNFLVSFQSGLFAISEDDSIALARRKTISKSKPVAPYDPDPLKAASKCFDRDTGKPIKIDDLATYREALAQYHLYPENKFLNGQYGDRGLTQRRHVKVEMADVHYIGKEANELEEQVFFGFDPEAQPEYGTESEAYTEMLEKARAFLKEHKLPAVASATGISARYLRAIRDGSSNVTPEMLKKIEGAMPAIEAAEKAELAREQELLDWARAECNRIGRGRLAKCLKYDSTNLAKVFAGKRRVSRTLSMALKVMKDKSAR